MVEAGVTTALVILWRDRTSRWRTLVAGALLTLMIAWSGHEDVLMGIALVLVVMIFAQHDWRQRTAASHKVTSPRQTATSSSHISQ